jgi:hypothetical protein
MNQKIEKIKAAVIALKRGAGRPRYPEEIKSAVRDLYRGGMGRPRPEFGGNLFEG